MSKVKFSLDDLRKISPEALDLSTKFADTLGSCTFCEVERLLRGYIERTRTLVHASRTAGLNTKALVEYDRLSGDAEKARIIAHFAGGERGVRVSKAAAEVFMREARQYAVNIIANNAPWLADVEAVGDDE